MDFLRDPAATFHERLAANVMNNEVVKSTFEVNFAKGTLKK